MSASPSEFTDLHVVPPLEEHKRTVVFLHGRGSTGAEFADEFFESQASDDRTLPKILPTVKWVFPTSKMRMSARFEMEMSQWFDMWSVQNPQERKELQIDGLRDSIAYLLTVLHNEASSGPPEQIILGGISQGCATAIHTLIQSGMRLGGFIGLSSWLPFQEEIRRFAETSPASVSSFPEVKSPIEDTQTQVEMASDVFSRDLASTLCSSKSALSTTVFLSHSKDDAVVPISNGEELRQGLAHLGMNVAWKTYEDGGHWVNEPQGVDDIVTFLGQRPLRPCRCACLKGCVG